MYLCEKTGKFLPADPVARVRMFQWMAEGAADYASVNQTIFFLGARMPEKVPDSAIKFYEDRFVNLLRTHSRPLDRRLRRHHAHVRGG